MARPLPPLQGKRFHRLEVLRAVWRASGADRIWLCRCDCGKLVKASSQHLRNGRTKSCGCYNREERQRTLSKHGHAITRNKKASITYTSWLSMIARCCNKKAPDYDRYGGRGISIVDRWRNSFENFLADMGERPSKAHSLERKHNDGDYEPDNCVWATRKEQSRNRRNTFFVTYADETLPAVTWSERTGVPAKEIARRLARGWSVYDALYQPTNRGVKHGPAL